MMTIHAVLFDMDGVLVDSHEAWFHLLQVTSRDLGGNAVTRDAFTACWGQGVEADVATFFCHSTAVEVSAHYEAHFADHARHVVANPDAAPVLAGLRDRGVATAVITNTPTPIAESILTAAQIRADLLVGAGDGYAAKPAPDMVRHACAKLGVAAGDAVMVGDSRYDREAARSAGVRFVGFGGIDGDEAINSLTAISLLLHP
jgi:phosphoglycolate phosphatase/AHBA synthesis associated protein